jgi:hypothetical protein
MTFKANPFSHSSWLFSPLSTNCLSGGSLIQLSNFTSKGKFVEIKQMSWLNKIKPVQNIQNSDICSGLGETGSFWKLNIKGLSRNHISISLSLSAHTHTHTHTPYSTVCSERNSPSGRLAGQALLKGRSVCSSHKYRRAWSGVLLCNCQKQIFFAEGCRSVLYLIDWNRTKRLAICCCLFLNTLYFKNPTPVVNCYEL